MAKSWFPVGRNGNDSGWRLDIVSLLAVIGESSIESHSQSLTSSWTCFLPRIIPAPQVLLKPSRPNRMPQVSAAVVGVHNGTMISTLNYFPNIIHPIEELQPFSFKVYSIKHRFQLESDPATSPSVPRPVRSQSKRNSIKKGSSTSSSAEIGVLENGNVSLPRRRTTFQKIASTLTGKGDLQGDSIKPKEKPRVPPQIYSPLNILSVVSCALTIGLLICAAIIKDGTACVALGTVSLVSSIVGYASSWEPVLMNRQFTAAVPPGDVIIRTREGAFILVRCDENVARELYTGTEECKYFVKTQLYRILVGMGTFLLMISVVLLGNCNFYMQAAIGSSYIILNGAFWAISLFKKDRFWDLSGYEWEDITPPDAIDADLVQGDGKSVGEIPSFTRTMWYAIRETGKIGWVRRSGAAPATTQWDEWLQQAARAATGGNKNRKWDAVHQQNMIVGRAESVPQAETAALEDTAAQHVPAVEVPPPEVK